MSNHHTFPYNPFDYVDGHRQQQLRLNVDALLTSYINSNQQSRGRRTNANRISYIDVGDMAYTIANDFGYGFNTDEKAVAWEMLVNLVASKNVNISGGLLEENIDHWGTGVSWGHILVRFRDSRHGTIGASNPEDSYTDGTLQDAIQDADAYERRLATEVFGFEIGFGVPRNNGDFNASINTVRTMFAFRSGGFQAFAREWNRVFIGRQYQEQPIFH